MMGKIGQWLALNLNLFFPLRQAIMTSFSLEEYREFPTLVLLEQFQFVRVDE